MTPRQKKVKWLPVFDRPQRALPTAPFEVHTGSIITLHYDRAGAENEVRWQRERYGKVAEIVQPGGQAANDNQAGHNQERNV